MGFEKVFALLQALDDVDTSEIETTLNDEVAEVNRISEGADARVNELLAENDKLMRELTEVKARNYELMTSVTADVTNEEDDEEEPEILSIDELFKEV